MKRSIFLSVLIAFCAAAPLAEASRVVYYDEYGEPVYVAPRRGYVVEERRYVAPRERYYVPRERYTRRTEVYERRRYRDRDVADHPNDHILPHHRILHRLFGF